MLTHSGKFEFDGSRGLLNSNLLEWVNIFSNPSYIIRAVLSVNFVANLVQSFEGENMNKYIAAYLRL